MTLSDVVADACEHAVRYRLDHDLHARVDAHNLISAEAGLIDAIQMSETLADHVHAELTRRQLHTPAVRNVHTGAVTFLTAPAGPGDGRPIAILDAHPRISAIRTVRGAPIALPGPADDAHIWQTEPTGHELLNFDVLLSITVSTGIRLGALPRTGSAPRSPTSNALAGTQVPRSIQPAGSPTNSTTPVRLGFRTGSGWAGAPPTHQPDTRA
ncbi:hypothetical protein ACFYTQ_35230 [Nocardia sp. NPDC004068]|uniref:hypothetical protein n=1 Tax=Nocardia sp. NPDC004068 TaxID=3364303 RepID=UPI0036BEDD5F